MPELPEIETLAQQLQSLTGDRIADVLVPAGSPWQGRLVFLKEALPGRRIESVSRRGKYLCLALEGGNALWIHLGMAGRLLLSQTPLEAAHVHLSLGFEKITGRLYYRDARRFGRILLAPAGAAPSGVSRLGEEPSRLTPERFAALYASRKAPIKSLLLNQNLMAGLGNIYADESLFRAGIDPRRKSSRLGPERLAVLHGAICRTLEEAISHGGSSMQDYYHADGSRGDFQKHHRVYRRVGEACFECRKTIRRVRLAGRSSYYCPNCQK